MFGSPEPFCNDFREGATPHFGGAGLDVISRKLQAVRVEAAGRKIEKLSLSLK